MKIIGIIFLLLLIGLDILQITATIISSSQLQTCVRDSNHPDDITLGCAKKFVVTIAVDSGQVNFYENKFYFLKNEICNFFFKNKSTII